LRACLHTARGFAHSLLALTWLTYEEEGREFWTQMDALVEVLDGIVADEAGNA